MYKICKSSTVGRYVVATEPIPEGRLVLQADPMFTVLMPDYLATHCVACCTRIGAEESSKRCDRCNVCVICETCTADTTKAAIHVDSGECDLLCHATLANKKSPIHCEAGNIPLYSRALLRANYLVAHGFPWEEHMENLQLVGEGDADGFFGLAQDTTNAVVRWVEGLSSDDWKTWLEEEVDSDDDGSGGEDDEGEEADEHERVKQEKQERRELEEKIKAQLPVKVSLSLSPERMIHLLRAVPFNQHGVTDFADNNPVGISLFPAACAFNHSCNPNVCWYVNRGVMSYRAMRNIAADEELSIVYMDVYDVFAERQKRFKSTYHVECGCPRCERSRAGEDEGDKLSQGLRSTSESDRARFESESERVLRTAFENAMMLVQQKKHEKAVTLLKDQMRMVEENFLQPTHTYLRTYLMKCESLMRQVHMFEHAIEFANLVVDRYDMIAQASQLCDLTVQSRFCSQQAQSSIAFLSYYGMTCDKEKRSAVWQGGRDAATRAAHTFGVCYSDDCRSAKEAVQYVQWFDAWKAAMVTAGKF